MKLRLLDLLVCPNCKGPFSIDIQEERPIDYSLEWNQQLRSYLRNKTSDYSMVQKMEEAYHREVISGILRCGPCSAEYEIINGIPILLSQELKTVAGAKGRISPNKDERVHDFMDHVKTISGKQKELFLEVQKANQSNYGFEWKEFSREFEGWETIYKEYYVFEEDDFFRGKIGLDAGCGMGRYALIPTRKGSEMIGLDLSNAIEISYEKSLSNPLFHAVQGDIFNLPFRDNCFDFAQTLGVIHITPDPETALLQIKKTVIPNGKIWIYVYPSFKDENPVRFYLLKAVNLLRRLTVKMPSHHLYYFLYAILPFVIVCLYYPSKIMFHVPFLRKFAMILPYNYDQYKAMTFREMHMNLFDRFGNPVERRYDREEMIEWMLKAKFQNYNLWFKDGWTVGAIK